MGNLEKRVSDLARANSNNRRLIILLGVLGLAVVSLGQRAAVPDVIQARKIEVVDEQGKLLLVLGPGTFGGGSIGIFDSTVSPSIIMNPGLFGTGQIIVYGAGAPAPVAMLGSSEDGDGSLSLFTRRGKEIFNSSSSGTGDYGLTTITGVLRIDSHKKKDTPLVILGADNAGKGVVAILSPEGEQLVRLPR
jgi:hypothetical protein